VISIVLLVVMLAATWLLIVRPQQARVKRHAALVASIQEGDRVVTSAGIIGIVVQIDDEQVLIESGDAELCFVRAAISAKIDHLIDLDQAELSIDDLIDEDMTLDEATGDDTAIRDEDR
jgi:preprotein translocase YajC subunit